MLFSQCTTFLLRTLFLLIHPEQKDLINLLKALKDNIENLNNCYRRSLEFDKDYRTCEESYGYKNEENIINNLIYVSDRWNCSFRIKWIIDLINLKKRF